LPRLPGLRVVRGLTALELALLHKFRYVGPYVNRLLVSAGARPFVEPVPWQLPSAPLTP